MHKEATEQFSEHLEGLIREIVFENEETGYRVLELENADGDLVTAVGTIPGVNPGEYLAAEGKWVEHPVYGEQFKVCSFSRTLPKGREEMQRYLASGAVKGVGNALAARIVAYFGDETFNVIERHPERLAEVKGIGPAAACTIGESFALGREIRETMMYLQGYDIKPELAYRIIDTFGSQTVSLVKKNPYILVDRINGIGFKKADEIALKMGVSENSPERLKACVLYVLDEAEGEGHCYLPFSKLEDEIYEAIRIEGAEVENAVTELSVSGKVRIVNDEDPAVYRASTFREERTVAGRLITMAGSCISSQITDADIAEVCKKQKIVLSGEQQEAIRMALTEGVSVITGGPGTGKTTILNTLLPLLKKQKETYILTSFTSRAAKRMAEVTGEEACTLHRLLEAKSPAEAAKNDTERFGRNEQNPLEGDVVIVDEFSMVDIHLFCALLRALAPGMRLVLVGDSDQLPSVGPGNVLSDILASGTLPSIRLTEIYRQAEASDIVVNAHRINNGQYPVFSGRNSDFFIDRKSTVTSVQEEVVDLVKNRLPKFAKVSYYDIQVMSPQRKGELGVMTLNRLLQKALNPPAKAKKEVEYRDTVFREGDRVMQTKNNYGISWVVRNEFGIAKDTGEGIFNGDIGVITRINYTEHFMTVLFDDVREVELAFSGLDDLSLAYAVTVHKSQGSQKPVVVLPLLQGPPQLYKRNLLYTAITRAERYVVIVGSEKTVNDMVDNNTVSERYTSLARALKEFQN